MKWLIYLLILVNIGFALWHIRSQEIPSAKPVQGEDQALKLILLKEYVEPAAAPVSTVASVNDAKQCYTLGPFKTAQIAATVRQKLSKNGINAQNRVSKTKTRPGFWVYLPATASRAEAQANIALLKSKQIKEYFMIVNGEYTNAISLGVFSQPDLAQRRHDDIAAIGFTVKMQKVDLLQREYWLDWPIATALSPAILDDIRRENSGIGQTERTCSPTK